MNRNDIDVKLFRYNPFDLKTVQLLTEEYPEFRVSFGEANTKQRFICYLILLYDLNTPLRIRYPDYILRKIECAKLAEFKKGSNGNFLPEFLEVMEGSNEKFNNAVVAYIKSFGSPDYMALTMYLNIFASEYNNSLKVSDSKILKDTVANIRTLQAQIAELTAIIFGGKEVFDLRTAIYKRIERDRPRVRPEDIAEVIDVPQKLKDNLGDYYEKDIEPLKFIGCK
jgi:hypothetical protein